MFEYLDYVFIVSGPYAGYAARIMRDDGQIPGFPYRVSVTGIGGPGVNVWIGEDALATIPTGFIPWYDQGNVEPIGG